MHRAHRSIALVLAAATLPLFAASAAPGQSMPPGQVSHRMSTRPMNSTDLTEPVDVPASTKNLLTSRSTPSIMGGGEMKVDTAAADLKKQQAALGSANQAYLTELVALEDSPVSDPFVVQYVHTLMDSITDATTQEEAEAIVKAAQNYLNYDLGSIEAQLAACGTADPGDTAGAAATRKKACTDALALKRKGEPAAIKELGRLSDILRRYSCTYSVQANAATTPTKGTNGAAPQTVTTPQYTYTYHRWWFPMNGTGCGENSARHLTPVQNFFGVSGPTEFASDAKYLYNAKLSTSQVNSQLMTATFNPGFLPAFQAVLSSTATSGSSNSSASTSAAAARKHGTAAASGNATAAPVAGSTDSTATAMAKIQAGGDFNLSLPAPLLYHASQKGSISGYFTPNVGFSINGFSGQNTITEATEYAINVPVEFYAQTYSLESGSNGLPSATFFVDLKPSAEVISTALAKAISPNTSKVFFLGQASVGIEFAQSVRISFQYLYSQKSIFDPTAGLSTTSAATQNPSGFHFAVSFSPQNAKKAAQN